MTKFDYNAWARKHLVEGATATAERLELAEVGAGVGSGTGDGTKRKVTVIEAGWGSSGYYSEAVLRNDGPGAWPAGTHMYMNHPSESEDREQPERRVEYLAAVLTKDPVWDASSKALVAEAQVFANWAPVIDQVAEHIGVSIRAIGGYEMGEAEGKQGPIITSIDEGISVDFVTKAGAGGKVGPLVEGAAEASAQDKLVEARNAVDWFASKIHSNFTEEADYLFGQGYITRDERIALSQAIGDALDAFNTACEDNVPDLMARDPYDTPMTPTPVYATEVLRKAEVLLAEGTAPSAVVSKAIKAYIEETNSRPSGGGKEPAVDTAELERQLTEVKDTVGKHETRIAEAEAERDTEKARADRAEDALAVVAAEKVVDDTIAEGKDGDKTLPELPERALARVKESVTKGKLPTDEDGKLDKDKLAEATRKAVKEEAEYLGQASGNGKVRGVGGNRKVEEDETEGETTKETTEALAGELGKLGLSEKAATVAAEGR